MYTYAKNRITAIGYKKNLQIHLISLYIVFICCFYLTFNSGIGSFVVYYHLRENWCSRTCDIIMVYDSIRACLNIFQAFEVFVVNLTHHYSFIILLFFSKQIVLVYHRYSRIYRLYSTIPSCSLCIIAGSLYL